jgi:hypothetical protein
MLTRKFIVVNNMYYRKRRVNYIDVNL